MCPFQNGSLAGPKTHRTDVEQSERAKDEGHGAATPKNSLCIVGAHAAAAPRPFREIPGGAPPSCPRTLPVEAVVGATSSGIPCRVRFVRHGVWPKFGRTQRAPLALRYPLSPEIAGLPDYQTKTDGSRRVGRKFWESYTCALETRQNRRKGKGNRADVPAISER